MVSITKNIMLKLNIAKLKNFSFNLLTNDFKRDILSI